MESRVPVPTDNIYKFYALFGLLLFIFCCGSSLYVTRTSNELVFSALPELESLKQISQPSRVEQMRISLLERKLEINKADKSTFQYAIGGLMGTALIAMVYGFWKWEKELQPILDRTAKAQMEIAELQLAKLRRELGTITHNDIAEAKVDRTGLPPDLKSTVPSDEPPLKIVQPI
jgi:hypothetical protein